MRRIDWWRVVGVPRVGRADVGRCVVSDDPRRTAAQRTLDLVAEFGIHDRLGAEK